MTRRSGRPRPQGIFKNFGQKDFGLNFRPLLNCNRFGADSIQEVSEYGCEYGSNRW